MADLIPSLVNDKNLLIVENIPGQAKGIDNFKYKIPSVDTAGKVAWIQVVMLFIKIVHFRKPHMIQE